MGQAWSCNLGGLGAYYGLYSRFDGPCALPLPVCELQHESVVANLAGVARGLMELYGLAWHPDYLEFYWNERPVFTASNAQIRQPIYASSVGLWRRYEDQLQPLIDSLLLDAVA